MFPIDWFAVATVWSIGVTAMGSSPYGVEALETLTQGYGPSSNDIIEDTKLDVMGLLSKYGYNAKAYKVETADGYLLTMHRIIGKKGEANTKDKPIVFVMHGLGASSADWILTGPQNDAFGYVLSNEGYDVWLGNARGNYYSRKHITLSPDQSAFWKFSFHEIGYYDVAAMIDYTLNVTGQNKLHYIGHSQGCSAFFALMSEKPEYNNKIKIMVALAPAVFISHSKNPIVRMYIPRLYRHDAVKHINVDEEIGKLGKLNEMVGQFLCSDGSIFQPICIYNIFIIGGFNKELFNTTLTPIIYGHSPAGGSVRQFAHFAQMYTSGRYRKYDFGKNENLKVYSQRVPPDYKLELVTTPVALYYGDNDWLVDPIDVNHLYQKLSNPIKLYRVPHPKFTHIDFLYAIGAKSLLYDNVIEVMKKYD